LAGDPLAADEFDALYRPRLVRTCANILGPRHPEIEAIVGRTLLHVLEKLKEGGKTGPLYPWIRQSCIRRSYAFLIKRDGPEGAP
jgi:hypothetical protein